jgi:hypothetical protein
MRLLRGLAAAVLGLILAVSSTVLPARADVEEPSNDNYWKFVDILIARSTRPRTASRRRRSSSWCSRSSARWTVRRWTC